MAPACLLIGRSLPHTVMAKVIAVGDILYTINGKRVELAVRNIIHNEPVLNNNAEPCTFPRDPYALNVMLERQS